MEQNRIIRLSTKIFAIVFAVLYAAITVVGTVGYSIWNGLLIATALLLPVAIPTWFILSLVLFLRAKKRGNDDLPALKHRLKTSVILLIFLAIMIALLFAFFACAISHM